MGRILSGRLGEGYAAGFRQIVDAPFTLRMV
jgi:hypothetical protein